MHVENFQEYYFVTIKAERYLKDTTGTHPSEVTFADGMVRGIFFIKDIKTYVDSEESTEYKVGDRALFFIYPFEWAWNLESGGVLSKFVINEEDGTLQSEYLARRGDPPMKMEDFEAEINRSLAASASSSS